MNDIEKQKTANVLSRVLGVAHCPMCNGHEFTLIGKVDVKLRHSDAHVPTVAIVCPTCGYMSLHACVTLGLPTGHEDNGDD